MLATTAPDPPIILKRQVIGRPGICGSLYDAKRDTIDEIPRERTRLSITRSKIYQGPECYSYTGASTDGEKLKQLKLNNAAALSVLFRVVPDLNEHSKYIYSKQNNRTFTITFYHCTEEVSITDKEQVVKENARRAHSATHIITGGIKCGVKAIATFELDSIASKDQSINNLVQRMCDYLRMPDCNYEDFFKNDENKLTED
ncbi:unnamed protein product [Didymodactylos carnosus]|uniref:Uncharacterized protein n=1 Tax=Didymodactylos carnosus TaxID=1234261 RepID=A0A816CB04_9BILA|nr:unnamed protein product [Didymodactylos carnosus]CAF1622103.1 unnamed protein product [Didymodactylos carnosus]CAF4379145.1 unnamed protein product [Didymodactylos carnosus]CAF4513329.1 unnamed protein product [Didymodactylos carnosus]